MDAQMITEIQRTLTAMYKRHELTSEEYEALLEDSKIVKVSAS